MMHLSSIRAYQPAVLRVPIFTDLVTRFDIGIVLRSVQKMQPEPCTLRPCPAREGQDRQTEPLSISTLFHCNVDKVFDIC
jgi:hypothetical protein